MTWRLPPCVLVAFSVAPISGTPWCTSIEPKSILRGGLSRPQGDLFGYVLDISGGVTGSLANFILPGMAYLAVTKDAPLTSGALGESNVRAYRIGCRVLIVFGFSVMVSVPVAVVLSAFGA